MLDRLVNVLAAGVVAAMLHAAFLSTPLSEAQGTLIADRMIVDQLDGMVAFFDSATCPTGFTEHTAARGRFIVGLPSGGTLGGTAGTPLTDRQSRTGGASHTHTITTNYTRPTASFTSPSLTYTNPTATYTRPTVTHNHTHNYTTVALTQGFVPDNLGSPAYITVGSVPSSGASAAPTVTGGGVTLSGGGASLSGGSVSLSGGGVTASSGFGGGSTAPAPSLQLIACEYNP